MLGINPVAFWALQYGGEKRGFPLSLFLLDSVEKVLTLLGCPPKIPVHWKGLNSGFYMFSFNREDMLFLICLSQWPLSVLLSCSYDKLTHPISQVCNQGREKPFHCWDWIWTQIHVFCIYFFLLLLMLFASWLNFATSQSLLQEYSYWRAHFRLFKQRPCYQRSMLQ